MNLWWKQLSVEFSVAINVVKAKSGALSRASHTPAQQRAVRSERGPGIGRNPAGSRVAAAWLGDLEAVTCPARPACSLSLLCTLWRSLTAIAVRSRVIREYRAGTLSEKCGGPRSAAGGDARCAGSVPVPWRLPSSFVTKPLERGFGNSGVLAQLPCRISEPEQLRRLK